MFASALSSLLLYGEKEGFVRIALSISNHCCCGRGCRSEYGEGCRGCGSSDRRGGTSCNSLSSQAAQFAGECVIDGDVDGTTFGYVLTSCRHPTLFHARVMSSFHV